MATSSIFAKVRITDEKNAKILVDALEKANNLPRTEPTTTVNLVTDKTVIKELFAKRLSK